MANKSGFVWYELMTSGDLDASSAFYATVVGWDVRDSGMPGMTYLIFGKNGVDVGGMMSWQAMGMDKPTTWKGHIGTSDVDAETKAVLADEGKEFRPPMEIPNVGRFSVVGDPQGAEYLLFQSNGQRPKPLSPNTVGAVGWNELATSDWEKAWEFYGSHYGWEKAMTVDMGPMGTYQVFNTADGFAGGGMMTLPPNAPSQQPAWLFYFTVDDINAAKQRVTDHGGTVTHGPSPVPGGAWILRATDPAGGSFALTAAR